MTTKKALEILSTDDIISHTDEKDYSKKLFIQKRDYDIALASLQAEHDKEIKKADLEFAKYIEKKEQKISSLQKKYNDLKENHDLAWDLEQKQYKTIEELKSQLANIEKNILLLIEDDKDCQVHNGKYAMIFYEEDWDRIKNKVKQFLNSNSKSPDNGTQGKTTESKSSTLTDLNGDTSKSSKGKEGREIKSLIDKSSPNSADLSNQKDKKLKALFNGKEIEIVLSEKAQQELNKIKEDLQLPKIAETIRCALDRESFLKLQNKSSADLICKNCGENLIEGHRPCTDQKGQFCNKRKYFEPQTNRGAE
jgi:hypothetical protein